MLSSGPARRGACALSWGFPPTLLSLYRSESRQRDVQPTGAQPSFCPCSVQEYLWEASQYLVKQVFNSIKEMFSATRDIQVCFLLLCSPLAHPHVAQGLLHGERWFLWVLARGGCSCRSPELRDCPCCRATLPVSTGPSRCPESGWPVLGWDGGFQLPTPTPAALSPRSPAELADRERQAHCAVGTDGGVGDTAGSPHRAALLPLQAHCGEYLV